MNIIRKPAAADKERYHTMQIVSIVLGVLALSYVGRLSAVPSPEQHEMSGIVQRVDHETITILPKGESKPVVFVWNKETRFVRDNTPTTVDALHGGAMVTIRCSHPVFGSKPVLYRVSWQTTQNERRMR